MSDIQSKIFMKKIDQWKQRGYRRKSMFRIHFQVLWYILGQNTEMVEEEQQKHRPVLLIQEDK